MRAVVDTNVTVSGIFFGGVPGHILSAWAAGQFDLVLSPGILAEYQRVGHELSIKYPDLAGALEPSLALIAMHATIVDAPELGESVSVDPDDDKFLAAALASDTEIVVSGDKDLLRISPWRGIVVLTPRQFLDQYLLAP